MIYTERKNCVILAELKFDPAKWVTENIWVKLAQHWEPNWLNIESLIGWTLRVRLTQHWKSNWLNIESQIDSTLRVKLTQILSSYPLCRVEFKFHQWLNFLGQNDSIIFSRFIVLAYTRFSWSTKFIILDWSFFDKLSATKGKFKNSCLP